MDKIARLQEVQNLLVEVNCFVSDKIARLQEAQNLLVEVKCFALDKRRQPRYEKKNKRTQEKEQFRRI